MIIRTQHTLRHALSLYLVLVSLFAVVKGQQGGGGNTLPGVIVTDNVSPDGPAPPTTYASYVTVDGEQQTLWVTFIATTPTTAPAAPVSAGTILDANAYLASLSSRAQAAGFTGQSSARKSFTATPVYLGAVALALCGLGALVII